MLPIGDSWKYKTLRSLKLKDANAMLGWMHDANTAACFQKDFMGMDIQRVEQFIANSWSDKSSLHVAVRSEADEYLGTISLKSVDKYNRSAEYAISMSPQARGTGAAKQGTLDIITYGFREMSLHRVYLNVRADNERAVRFYQKMGFVREGLFRDALETGPGEYVDLLWFSILESEFAS